MKIVENSKWVFDEFIEKVEEKFPSPITPTIDMLAEEKYGGIIEDLYDVWYYYINSPTMRYVNNYYQFEKYDPKIYKKNMEKAIHYLCKLEEERIIYATRQILAELDEYSDNHPILDINLNRYEIYFVWVAEPGACKACRDLDGRILEDTSRFVTHWNCRCHLEQHIRVLSPEGAVIADTIKNL